ncbi:ABC transporter permease subunit [Erysipelothrix sp. D19-032]
MRYNSTKDVRIPESISPFFASLKIAVSYAVVGVVIAEWLGGTDGLGVYMTRVRKAYAFDKMFAVIVLISLLSLLLMGLVNVLERKAMPWKDVE